jgi:hypothetical protein
MNRSLAVFLLYAFSACSSAAEQAPIVGVWRYAGEVDTKADGSPAPIAALSVAQGLLIYTADGHMSVTLMPKARSWSTDDATADQLRETIGNGTAYAGRYEIDAKAQTITHLTSVSMEPQFEGKRLTRQFALDGDTLELMGTFPYEGETIHFKITWKRVKQ